MTPLETPKVLDKTDHSNLERRQARRLPINAEGLLTLLNPEETFTPTSVRCLATDISTTGIRVRTYQLAREDYHKLLRGRHFAKLQVDLPFLSKPLEIRAKVVWLDYHERDDMGPAHMQLGLAFEERDQATVSSISYVMDSLSADAFRTTTAIPIPRKL